MSSKPFLGFVLLTHEKPAQILRLIDRLNFMFDHPPIACHHDFSKCNLPQDSIPQNVSFVKPHLKTAWGDWSLTEGSLKAIKLLYNRPDSPEWFILLSGTDYPVKPADRIINDLKNSPFDAHISFLKLVKSELKDKMAKAAFLRYQTLYFTYPSFVHLLQSIRRLTWWRGDIYLKKSIYTRWFIPFSKDFPCFYGSQWFSANRKSIQYILKFDKSHPRIRAFYKKVRVSDSSYFHTILANSSHLKINTENWRYVEWVSYSSHPKQLTTDDFSKLVESEAHFARKFNMDENPKILDQLDEVIAYKPDRKET